MYTAYKLNTIFNITEFYSAFTRRIYKDYRFSGEIHNFWEMVYVTEGNVIVSADNDVVKLKSGSVIFHKPLEFHSLSSVGDEPATVMVITFMATGEFIKKFENRIIELTDEQIEDAKKITKFFPSPIDHDSNSIVNLLQTIEKKPALGQKFKNLVELFIISLENEPSAKTTSVSSLEIDIYKKAIDVLNNHKYTSISIEETASLCNVSPAYLKKVFRKYTGLGIHKYFLKLKLSEAKQMIKSGVPISAIAEKLSFCNQNYFSVVFRREEGMSPSKYKNLSK